jgi:hypothetical protein
MRDTLPARKPSAAVPPPVDVLDRLLDHLLVREQDADLRAWLLAMRTTTERSSGTLPAAANSNGKT